MARTAAVAGPPPGHGQQIAGPVSVVAGFSWGVNEALEFEGFAFDRFDDVEALLGQPVEFIPSLIVVCTEEAASGPLGCIEPLTRRFENVPIMLVCASVVRWGVRAALAAGVSGIVLATEVELALASCLHAVYAGQICVPRSQWRQVEPPVLSSREKQILGLVVMSFTNAQIARQLFLAESTVKSHLSSAFAKLGVRSRNEAVDLILDPGRGLGMGILALGGEPVESPASNG
jgi:DNA-binding NarL/FixJ family response regulator